MAYEQVSLYGMPIVARRRVGYARINPAEAREIFIRSALVEGQWRTRHHFFARNAESGPRRRSWRSGPGAATSSSTTRRSSTSTTPGSRPTSPRRRTSTPGGRPPGSRRPSCSTSPWTTSSAGAVDRSTATLPGPAGWSAGHELAVELRVRAGRPTRDGVTVEIPLAVLNQLDAGAVQLAGARDCAASWRRELIRSLPKTYAGSSCRPPSSPGGHWTGSASTPGPEQVRRTAFRRRSAARSGP